MAAATAGATPGERVRVKMVNLGRAPELKDLDAGTTAGAFAKAVGMEGREMTVGGNVVGADYVLKDGDAVVFKDRLQAGRR